MGMTQPHAPRALRTRLGKSRAPKLTAEDHVDIEAAREGLRLFREHPEVVISSEEIRRHFGIK